MRARARPGQSPVVEHVVGGAHEVTVTRGVGQAQVQAPRQQLRTPTQRDRCPAHRYLVQPAVNGELPRHVPTAHDPHIPPDPTYIDVVGGHAAAQTKTTAIAVLWFVLEPTIAYLAPQSDGLLNRRVKRHQDA